MSDATGMELPKVGLHAFFDGMDRRVEVEWIGEGRDGDFDPSDPDDYPHLRFNVMERAGEGWEQMENGSFCCQVDARAASEVKLGLAAIVFQEIDGADSIKRICERLSWTTLEDVEAAMGTSSPRM